ncbi:class I SAM-dependent methyltransferase [Williamsia sp. M5A3_1d]
MDRLSSRLVDANNPRSLSYRARKRRWLKFAETFPDVADMRVLDLGGTPDFWRNAPSRPGHLTLVNMVPATAGAGEVVVLGDACDPPSAVLSERYDLVVSNSLIEHVGGHSRRQELSDVIRSVGDSYWVQTPYRYFPIEPHWMFPGLQFLPFEARVRVTQQWKIGNMQTADRQTAIDNVAEVELLGITQMRDYFPDGDIWAERAAGLIKSMVSIRRQ